MNKRIRKLRWWFWFLLGMLIYTGFIGFKHSLPLQAQESAQVAQIVHSPTVELPKLEQNSSPEEEDEEENPYSEFQPFDKVTADTEKLTGLFALYRNQDEGKIYLEIQPKQLNKNYLCVTTLSTGIGEAWLLRGMPLDDFLFSFRRLQDKVQFALPNIRFRARPGEPTARSLKRSFSDSILFSLPIVSINPDNEALLIDLGNLLMGAQDLSGLSQDLGFVLGAPYFLDANNSYFSQAEAFPSNIELESVYGFSSGGDASLFSYLPSVPDSRAFSLAVHYSFSELPTANGYVPRLADDRLGYFITAYKDLSNRASQDNFIRYIERWHLEPTDPTAELSPPKEPIVFWIENTVPLEYRKAFREGILAWNKAFEQAGFKDAIEARQMPDDADWNPADIRYNTIRWSNSLNGWFLGIGPSRTNPLTGQILDADIVINAEVIDFLSGEYRDLLSLSQSSAISARQFEMCNPSPSSVIPPTSQGREIPADELKINRDAPLFRRLVNRYDFCYGASAYQQLGMGALSMDLGEGIIGNQEQLQAYINQYLTHLVAHEVGHTLGLRHNFHGSTMLMPEELNNTEITQSQGLVSSVMDYTAVNLAPPGVEQGDYFSTTVGPYDSWAIEYGYKPSGERFPEAEKRFLDKIAQRAAEPELAYGTDEDYFGFNDPDLNPFDLSGDVLQYSQWQMDNARQMWSSLNKRYPVQGDSYSEVREKFNQVFFYYFQQARLISNYVGGRYFSRNHPGDPNSSLPFASVSVEKQRQALTILQDYVFDPNAFEFPPQLLNQLAPSRWNHWGNPPPVFALDYPIHDYIFWLQGNILHSLLDGDRLSTLRDLELKNPPGKTLMLPELFESLTQGIWTEVLQPSSDQGNIDSIRRSLQREHLSMLTNMVLRRVRVPEDARTLAWYELQELNGGIERTLRKKGDSLDTYTKAHLAEALDRIGKTLDAQLQSKSSKNK